MPYEFKPVQSLQRVRAVLFAESSDGDDAKKLSASPTWPTVTCATYRRIQYASINTSLPTQLLMDTYAAKYFNQGVLEKDKVLYPGYAVPDGKTVEDFRKAIEALPPQDSPEIFGLHPRGSHPLHHPGEGSCWRW